MKETIVHDNMWLLPGTCADSMTDGRKLKLTLVLGDVVIWIGMTIRTATQRVG